MKKLLQVKENEKNFSHIEIEVIYHKDGRFGRGYYLHADPVEIVNRGGYTMSRHELFTGSSMLLINVTRKSKKAEAEAEAEAEKNIDEIVDLVLDINSLELEDVKKC